MKAHIHHFLVLATTLASATLLAAKDDNQGTYTDPAKVDADYAVQGEYTGKLDGGKSGAHLIALGDAKFDLVIYPGGLPGDGWDGKKDKRIKASGATADGVTTFKLETRTATLKDGKLTIQKQPLGDVVGSFERTVRKSPTLGKKPPEGAVVLFDGSNLDAWKDGAKMTADKLLEQGVTSKQEFQDFQIHIEFRTPYKPKARGQGRGNSGFYAHGRYEVQILDSFGLEGEHNECGGVYSTQPPLVNMCYPPLTWQTYDIDFTAAKFDAQGKKTDNAKISVKQNGVETHKETVCDHATTASPKKEGPQPGPIYFQNHGNPVRFQNLWVLPK
ncbi:MAG: hypothetical protein ACI9NC_005770 [Verrucomicrobiales bacterium]|jgi:hypothetical protein